MLCKVPPPALYYATVCVKLTLGIAFCCLLWCCLAGAAQQDQARQAKLYCSCCELTASAKRPVIVFNNWGAGPLGAVGDWVIATTDAPEPVSQRDWRFHLLRSGLCIDPNITGLQANIAVFPAGAGVGLVATNIACSDTRQNQLFAACSVSRPQNSADWVVSPTGIHTISGMGGVAGAGTDNFIAAALLPEPAVLGLGPQRIPGIYLAVAKLPLSGAYAEWNTVCVQLDKFPGSFGWQHAKRMPCRVHNLSLVACGDSLYLACSAEVLKYNPAGFKTEIPAMIIGRCRDPLGDPSHWEFAVIESGPEFAGVSQLVSDGTQLYVAYELWANGKYRDTWVAGCPIADALNPGAWSKDRAAPGGPGGSASTLAVIGKIPGLIVANYFNPIFRVTYVTGFPGMYAHWMSCPMPILADLPSLSDVGGRPAFSSFSYDNGLEYGWANSPVSWTQADWHMTTVFAGKIENYKSTASAPAANDIFPPIPVPGPTEKLAAGAVRIPAFKLTWQLALLFGLVLAVVAWSVLCWRKRRARTA